MYQKNQLIPIDLYNQYDGVQVDRFSDWAKIPYKISIKQMRVDIENALKTQKHQHLLQTLFSYFTMKFLGGIGRDVNFEWQNIHYKRIFSDKEKITQIFNSNVNFKELDIYLEEAKSSKYVESIDTNSIATKTILILYKYYYINLSSLIYWSDSDNEISKSKYSVRSAFKALMDYDTKKNFLRAKPKALKDGENLKNNLSNSSNLQDFSLLIAGLNEMEITSFWKYTRREIWKVINNSIIFKNGVSSPKRNEILRPFYYYLLRNQDSDTNHMINNPHDSSIKLDFRRFKRKIE